jgi:hypothetical protein
MVSKENITCLAVEVEAAIRSSTLLVLGLLSDESTVNGDRPCQGMVAWQVELCPRACLLRFLAIQQVGQWLSSTLAPTVFVCFTNYLYVYSWCHIGIHILLKSCICIINENVH